MRCTHTHRFQNVYREAIVANPVPTPHCPVLSSSERPYLKQLAYNIRPSPGITRPRRTVSTAPASRTGQTGLSTVPLSHISWFTNYLHKSTSAMNPSVSLGFISVSALSGCLPHASPTPLDSSPVLAGLRTPRCEGSRPTTRFPGS